MSYCTVRRVEDRKRASEGKDRDGESHKRRDRTLRPEERPVLVEQIGHTQKNWMENEIASCLSLVHTPCRSFDRCAYNPNEGCCDWGW